MAQIDLGLLCGLALITRFFFLHLGLQVCASTASFCLQLVSSAFAAVSRCLFSCLPPLEPGVVSGPCEPLHLISPLFVFKFLLYYVVGMNEYGSTRVCGGWCAHMYAPVPMGAGRRHQKLELQAVVDCSYEHCEVSTGPLQKQQ